MKKLCLPKGRRRNTVTLLIVLALAAVLLALNLLLPYAMRRANVYIDITPEGMYTLTDAMKEEVSSLDSDVEILFLSDEDRLLDHGLLRYVYIMSRKLSEQNAHISVRTEDLSTDPTVADAFKTAKGSTVSASSVIVHSAGRYKILSPDAFFCLNEDEEYASFNGEYTMASAILSVTTYAEGPYAYFAVGHGERYYLPEDEGSDPSLSAFASLLTDKGLRVGTLNLDEVDAIPNDCVLLIFVGTEEDYSAGDIYDYGSRSALKKLDEYLFKRKSVMVFRDALDAPLPNLEDYLAEWGIAFTPTHVTAPEDALADSLTGEKNGDRLVAAYPDSDLDAPGYALVKDIASFATPPKTVLANAMALEMTFPDRSSVRTSVSTTRAACPVFYAGASAKAVDKDGYTVKAKEEKHILAMVGIETSDYTGESLSSYVFAAGSTAMISNEYLADGAFGNGDVVASILRTVSRTDVYSTGGVGSSDPNSPVYGGKWFEETHLSQDGKNTVFHSQTEWSEYAEMTVGRVVAVTVAILIVPVLVLPMLGTVVLRRRKNR